MTALTKLEKSSPAFYIYLIIVFFLLRSLSLFDWQQFMPSVFFLEDYHPRYLWNDRQWFTGHTWSLAVEEQFYFLIAFVFLFLNKKIITEKQVLNILVMIVFLVPLIRISYMFINAIPEFLRGSLHRSFETVADSLAVGGILALRQEKIIRSQIFLFFKNKIWLLILIIMLLQMCNSSWTVATFGLAPRYFYNLIGLCGVNICTGLLLLHVIHFSGENAFAKFLNTPVMIKIGLWSYSIYLWQQVWLYTWDMPLAYKLAGILICSVASYYLIEKTVLAWRDGVISRQKFRRYSCQ